ncbi:MAG: type IV toxin-antitoxin system AbiEi family antitoxin [bacterium]
MNTEILSRARIEKALADSLRKLLDQVGWLHPWKLESIPAGQSFDFRVRLSMGDRGTAVLFVECRNELRPSMFRQLLDRPLPPRGAVKTVVQVLGLPSVSPRMAELCAEHGWSWFDLAGNCRLDVPGLLHIERSGIPAVHRRARPAANLSTPVAGRVIRALLLPDNAGVCWTQRHLAEHFADGVRPIAEPSLGLVNKVVRFLRDEALIEEGPNGGIRVLDPLKLLFAWRDAYRFDRHVRRNYFTLLQGKNLHDALANFGTEAGGYAVYAAFSAADLQAPHVRQPKTWLYTREAQIAAFEKTVEAKVVESGENVVVLIPDDDGVFYLGDGGALSENRLACTNEVQTYVDLCHCGGRGAEAAEAVLEQCLKPKWKERGLKV